jgi:uncharacterized cupredoxin-like copper-binding protein
MSRVYKFAVLVFLVTGAACGGGSGSEQTQSEGGDQPAGGSDRTVQVEMVEHAFNPADLGTVKKGETITFKFTNTGKVDHEAFIGDAAAQLAYVEQKEEIAAAHTGDAEHADDGHDDHPEGSLHLAPGATGELTYTFAEAGEVEIACYEEGHYEAGMRLTIPVQ